MQVKDRDKIMEEILKSQDIAILESANEILNDINNLELNLNYTKYNVQKLSNTDINKVDYETMKVCLLATMVRQKHIQEVMIKILNGCFVDLYEREQNIKGDD